ncbi:WD40 repeat-like protein [Mycena sanguinolenta]|uniref:WD40 repeat-like protein n=1 Tax=Mycena sanguinolenta TaxID=230812 RepID=A0A8H6ZB72_9AGAR|nr:WD40 repeat-like protein [Mycena sanguinolenta]
MEEFNSMSRGIGASQVYIGNVYGGIGGTGGPGAYGGMGGMGQGPGISAGMMHINNMYGASRQAHTMLLPWLAPRALFNADTVAGASARRACTENTRVGLLSRLKEWAHDSDSSPIFWLSGMAGTGKSTVAYTLCKHWRAQGSLGASFFCSRDDTKARSRISVIPTIVQQLLLLNKPFAHLIEQVPIELIIPASDEHIDELLAKPWSSATSQSDVQLKTKLMVVVIDALDEIENDQGSKLIKQLIQALSGSKGLRGLKFFVTSRPHPRIVDECSSINERAVYHMEDINPREASQDVRRFLDAELADLPAVQLEGITAESGGLFIYASTIVRYLHPPNFVLSPKQKEKRLNMLKTTGSHVTKPHSPYEFLIDSLYRAILTQALPDIGDEVEISKRVLYCVITTCRPLKLSDLAALVVDATEEPDDIAVHNSLQLFYAVLYVSARDRCIYTFHKSFSDFILDPHRSPEYANPARSYFVERTHDCLAIMFKSLHFNFCNLTSSFLFDEDDKGLLERVETSFGSELRYACQYWAAHLASVQQDFQHGQQLTTLLLKFCSLKVLFWMEAMNLMKLDCRLPLHLARNWTLQVPNAELNIYMAASQRLWISFSQSPAMRSTPHLYISSLATELALTTVSDSSALEKWRKHFPGLPLLKYSGILQQRKLMTLTHTSEVFTVAMSPTSTHIVSGLNDSNMWIWDAATGIELMRLKGHTDSVRSVAFSPDAARIVSGSLDKTVRIWDAITGNEVMKIEGHSRQVWSVAFSPDGTQIVSGSYDKTVRIWDATTGNEVMKMEGHTDYVLSVAFSPNGAQIVSGSEDQTVQIWDVTSGKNVMQMKGHRDRVWSVAFSPNSAHVVSGSGDTTVRIWDVATGNEVTKLQGHAFYLRSVAFSPNGAQIVSGSGDETVRIWDSTTGKELTKIEGHGDDVWSVEFSSNGAQIVSGSSDGTIRIWDATIGIQVVKEGHNEEVNSVAFSPNGTQIVSGSEDMTVRIWDPTTGNQAKKMEGHSQRVWSVAFSPDGLHIASGSGDSTVIIWDAGTGEEIRKLEGHSDDVTSIAFSPSSTQVVSGSGDKTVRVWNITTGIEMIKMEGHSDHVSSVAFSLTSAHIVSGSMDNTIQVWDANTGNNIMKVEGHTYHVRSVAFAPNGKQVVSGSSDGTIRIWDVTTGDEVMQMEGLSPEIWSVAFSPNSAQIVSGSNDGSVQIWDAITGSEIMKIQENIGGVLSVTFAPTGIHIMSGSTDSTIRLWDTRCNIQSVGLGTLVGSPTGNVSAGDSDGMRIWQTLTSDQLSCLWHPQENGWVVLSGHADIRLFWYPPEFHSTLPTLPCIQIISTRAQTQLAFDPHSLGLAWKSIFSPQGESQ